MTLKEINELNLQILTLSDVDLICKKYNCIAMINNGKLVRFEVINKL